MAEDKDKWKGVGYGVETRAHQLATIFDGVLHAVSSGTFEGPEAVSFLERVDPKTGLKNRVLIARAAADL